MAPSATNRRLRYSIASARPAHRRPKKSENLISGEGALGSGSSSDGTLLNLGGVLGAQVTSRRRAAAAEAKTSERAPMGLHMNAERDVSEREPIGSPGTDQRSRCRHRHSFTETWAGPSYLGSIRRGTAVSRLSSNERSNSLNGCAKIFTDPEAAK